MKLEKKRALASRALKLGQKRIIFNVERLSEIKEAITKQDIKDLKQSGAISVKEKKGRRKVVKRKTRRRAGSIKKKVNTRKQDYATLTRKLRAHLTVLKRLNTISPEDLAQLRKEIRSKSFRSLSHMKESIKSLGEKN